LVVVGAPEMDQLSWERPRLVSRILPYFSPGKIETLMDAFFLLAFVVGVFGFLPWRLFNSPLK